MATWNEIEGRYEANFTNTQSVFGYDLVSVYVNGDTWVMDVYNGLSVENVLLAPADFSAEDAIKIATMMLRKKFGVIEL